MSDSPNKPESAWAKLKKLNVEVKMPKRGGSKAKPVKAKPAKAEVPKQAAKAARIKRPQVKTPQISLPPTVAGAVANLRERGLLPVAVVLVLAILAVPLLLSGGSSSSPPKAAPSAAAGDAIETQQAVVLANNSGVREYKRRLDGSQKDPFVQQYQAPTSGGGDASTAVVQTGGGSAVTPSGGAVSGPDSTTGSSGGRPIYHYAADLYVGLAGKNLKLRQNVKQMTSLPNDNVRAVAYIGVPFDRPSSAQFLVSDDVVKVSGKAHCALGTGGCNAVSLKVGEQMKLEMADGTVYAIKLAGTHLVRDENVVQATGSTP